MDGSGCVFAPAPGWAIDKDRQRGARRRGDLLKHPLGGVTRRHDVRSLSCPGSIIHWLGAPSFSSLGPRQVREVRNPRRPRIPRRRQQLAFARLDDFRKSVKRIVLRVPGCLGVSNPMFLMGKADRNRGTPASLGLTRARFFRGFSPGGESRRSNLWLRDRLNSKGRETAMA